MGPSEGALTTPATMRAAVLHGQGDLRVEPVPVPSPAAGEVLLAVGTVGLCGTDASELVHGPQMFPVLARHRVTGHLGPMVIGHEFSGRVVGLGAGVDPGWLHREVASCGAVSCGACEQCAQGRTNLCVDYSAVGLHRAGALAEFVATPVGNCAPVDDLGLPPDAAALGQPMSIAVHACRRGRLQPAERVLVLGVGGIGAFLVYAATAAGAHVVAVDASEARLALARRLGAYAALPAQGTSARDVEAALAGPAHLVFEATGRPTAFEVAAQVVRPGGRLVQVGLPAASTPVDLRQWALRELELIGTNAMVRGLDFDQALRLVASRAEGWADVAPLALTLDEVATDGLAAIAAGQAQSVKILVDPHAPRRRATDTTPRTAEARETSAEGLA